MWWGHPTTKSTIAWSTASYKKIGLFKPCTCKQEQTWKRIIEKWLPYHLRVRVSVIHEWGSSSPLLVMASSLQGCRKMVSYFPPWVSALQTVVFDPRLTSCLHLPDHWQRKQEHSTAWSLAELLKKRTRDGGMLHVWDTYCRPHPLQNAHCDKLWKSIKHFKTYMYTLYSLTNRKNNVHIKKYGSTSYLRIGQVLKWPPIHKV